MSKVADFNLSYLHLAPLLGVSPFEFCRDRWHQKTRIHGLSCGIVCMILRLATLVQYQRVTDTHIKTKMTIFGGFGQFHFPLTMHFSVLFFSLFQL